MKIIHHLIRGAIYSRSVIAAATIISFTVFLFVSSSEKSWSLGSYTKSITWSSLWQQNGRLKTFAQHQRELYECQYRAKSKDRSKCPSYFAWIHEDLAPWSESGITKESMQESRTKADFKATIINGKLYYERYNKCFQTRDDYTLWGLLMLLERYPGQVPDLELYFVCGDHPQVLKKDYDLKQRPPPPIFTYCETREGHHYDIIFPDWSFWGWPEVNISPWPEQLEKIANGARKPWTHRQPLAHWKGNVFVGTPVRTDLLHCNHSDFKLVVYHQNWGQEVSNGFKTSSLAEQCDYRYKVYAEGRAWSVSLKYITACESTTLLIEPEYWEFFARSWLPYVHYWPLSRSKMCTSIKDAVDWGNLHPTEAQAIGRCGKVFLETELTMDYVYQYMFHLLQRYAKLLKFKPVAPEGVQPMSLNSTIPWHELSMPKRTNETNSKESKLCFMPARNRADIDMIIARQTAGYQKASQQN